MTAEVLLLCGTEALPLFQGTLDALANVLPHATRVELPRLNHGAAKTRAANPGHRRPAAAVLWDRDQSTRLTASAMLMISIRRPRAQPTVEAAIARNTPFTNAGESSVDRSETSWTASEIATASGTRRSRFRRRRSAKRCDRPAGCAASPAGGEAGADPGVDLAAVSGHPGQLRCVLPNRRICRSGPLFQGRDRVGLTKLRLEQDVQRSLARLAARSCELPSAADAAEILARSGVDLDLLASGQEERNLDLKACLNGSRLGAACTAVTLQAGSV